MNAARFLIGTLANGEQRWASIDETAHHLEAAIADRRFGAYLKPFKSEADARAALIAAGAFQIEAEVAGKQRKRWPRARSGGTSA